jgi:DNA-binding MarR family transcriptional regulator
MCVTTEQEQPKTRERSFRRYSVLAWLHILRITNRVHRASTECLRACDPELSRAQFDVIAHLGVAEGMQQNELAQRLLVTQGNVTQLLDKMEKRGLLQRHSEGRCNRLSLTEEGRALFDTVVPAIEDVVAQQFAGLSEEEQRELQRLLAKLERSQR